MSITAGNQVRLVLLFTYRMSLEVWKRQGLLDREIGYYRFMQEAGLADLHLLTYGTNDASLAGDVEPFTVVPRPAGVGSLRYSLMAPFMRSSAFRGADVIKSNQSRGAWTGIVAKLRRRSTKFVVRCGFVRTEEIMRTAERRKGLGLWYAQAVERLSFRCADAVIVTSRADKRFLEAKYRIDGRKVWIIPNSVDDTLFTPRPGSGEFSKPLRILAIGRLVRMKNFQAIIEAAAEIDGPVDMTIIGEGPYRDALQKLASECSVAVRFIDSVPNAELPGYFHATDIFVMPQVFGSGMSKVILEAMACGVLTVASDIEAHREVITDGRNGCLTAPDAPAVAQALRRVTAMSPEARVSITRAARADVEARYSMRGNAVREMDAYRRLVAEGHPRAGAVTRQV